MILEGEDIYNLPNAAEVTRICDECGKQEVAKVHSVLQGRKIRKEKIDLCWHCANSKKYRKIPHGENNKHWRHGISCGYRRVYDDKKEKRVLEHVIVVEKHLGRTLNKNEHIHHINLNKLDCHIDNLFICDGNSGHQKIHSSLKKCGYELFKKGEIFFYKGLYIAEKKDFVTLIKMSEKQLREINSHKFYIKQNRGKNFEMFYLNTKIGKIWKTRWKKKHIFIAELFLGRKLFYGECVHHIDGDDTNNDLSNLLIMSRKNHLAAHNSLEKVSACFLNKRIEFNKSKGIYELIQGKHAFNVKYYLNGI